MKKYPSRRLLALKAIRQHIITHPGCTAGEIMAAVHCSGLMALQSRGLAYWKRDDQGVARWYVKPNLSRPWIGEPDPRPWVGGEP
jgi:hypothetical protein